MFIGDSNLENLKKMQTNKKKLYLRISGLSELEDVINFSDVSLQSELKVIKELNQYAKRKELIHEIILMFDLGDLREGIYYTDDYLKIVKEILSLDNIRLLGIGVNLTCYGGVIPTVDVLERLKIIKEKIEEKFAYPLKIISGGNSSSLYLLDKQELDRKSVV